MQIVSFLVRQLKCICMPFITVRRTTHVHNGLVGIPARLRYIQSGSTLSLKVTELGYSKGCHLLSILAAVRGDISGRNRK